MERERHWRKAILRVIKLNKYLITFGNNCENVTQSCNEFHIVLNWWQINLWKFRRRKMQHTEGKFIGHNNFSLYRQAWLPDGIPIAILVVVHGIAEHSGRYTNLVNYFIPKGYAVYSFDLRGHGKSDGKRSYVERFSYYIDDLKTFCDMVHEENKNAKVFMIGHSMGSTIAIDYALEHQSGLQGLIISGTTLKAGSSINKASILMARILSVLMPKMGVTALDSNGISRDKAVVTAYINDPLNYTGKLSARVGAELLKTMAMLQSRLSEITLPLLIMQGTHDRISDPSSSKLLFDGVSSKDKTMKLYEGFYHEIFNDPERLQVFSDMEAWLKARV
jgi:alpha-beta hydrolase superfamily lysophospholipase